MPAEVECPECEGAGEEGNGDDTKDCDACGGRGYFLLTHCPGLEIDREIQEFCPLSDLFKEGIPPCSGGAMDQSQWFFAAHLRLANDENKIKSATGSF